LPKKRQDRSVAGGTCKISEACLVVSKRVIALNRGICSLLVLSCPATAHLRRKLDVRKRMTDKRNTRDQPTGVGQAGRCFLSGIDFRTPDNSRVRASRRSARAVSSCRGDDPYRQRRLAGTRFGSVRPLSWSFYY